MAIEIGPQTAKGLRAIIFDLDGVLIDSSSCHADAFVEVLTPLGVRDFEYRRFAGWRTPEVIRTVMSEYGLPLDPDQVSQLAEAKSRLARRKLESSDPVRPGCGDMLRSLSQSYPLALASSASRPSVELFFRLTGTASLFKSVLSGDDVQQAKPHPEIYERTIRTLGLEPSSCLVVEDAASGVKAAKAAGAKVIGLAVTLTALELEACGADLTIDQLSDLPRLLQRGAL
jgi:beta-phosphoglucomutase